MNTADPASVNTFRIPGYELLRQLGSGGMGTVYLARQTSLNRHVAIKVLDQVDDPSARRRFERESLLAASVTHPGIVFMIDSGTVDGVPFLVQEFVDGPNLADVLAERSLSAAEVCELLAPVVAALMQLHQSGILHRDIKPRNVLISEQGQPMLSDFGLAVCAASGSSLTRTDVAVGTFDYMAPEQRHRLQVDERADQYSLAAVAYEMLTGEKPAGAFKPPSEVNLQLPAAVDAVLLRGLSRDPDDRFPDVARFFDALRSALLPEPLQFPRWLGSLALTAALSSLLTWAILAPDGSPRTPGRAQSDAVVSAESGVALSPENTRSPEARLPEAGSRIARSQATGPPIADRSLSTDHSQNAGSGAVEPVVDLHAMTVSGLRDYARELGLTGYSGLSRLELLELIESGGRDVELPPGWKSEIRLDAAGRRYRWYVSPDGKSFRRPPEPSAADGEGDSDLSPSFLKEPPAGSPGRP